MTEIAKKIKLFHTLLHATGTMPNKRDMVGSYNVESTTELTEVQLDELNDRLFKLKKVKYSETSAEIRELRSQVMVQLNRCGVYQDQNDWEAVNRFLLDKRVAGKLMYEMNIGELRKTAKKLRLIADKKIARDKAAIKDNVSLN